MVADTSVVSIIYNQDSRAPFYERHLEGRRVFVSFQTVEELYHWPSRNGWSDRRRNDLIRHVDQYEVVWPDYNLIQISAQLRAERERSGRRLNTADAWIAASALLLDCPLATDDNDFSELPGLTIIRHGER